MKPQLEGLILPPEDATINIGLWLGLGLLICLLTLAIWRWKKSRQTAKAIANKQLHSLQQEIARSGNSTQVNAQKLVSILCKGLSIKHLDQYRPKDFKAWGIFQSSLNQACYSTNTEVNINLLIPEAKRWLDDDEC